MANSSLTLTSLDFDTLNQNFVTFLQTQSIFKDYNFKGSNIRVLLDVMAYNSYLNSFYLNMVASEMFLDSAQKYDSIVSHAKELNYLPRSYKSSTANVSMTIDTTGIELPFSIPKGTMFSGTNSNGTFTFCTKQSYTYTSPNTQYTVSDLQVYEGLYVNNSYIMDYNNEVQRFVLTNQNIDLNSLTVTVYENNLQDVTNFTKVDTLFGLSTTSNVYFVQSAQNMQYEILFGDGFLGRKPKNEALIVAEYLVCAGSDADGVSNVSIISDLSLTAGGEVTVNSISLEANSTGGANSELLESIRFYAPRYFATQQRAVASDDYASIVLSKFSGYISDINIYGGEQLEPKQYGRVVLCLKPTVGTIAPDYVKDEISNFILDYVSLPTRVIISDPDYFYCGIVSTVQYDKNATTKLSNDIKSVVLNQIKTFSTDNLQKFTKDLRYSKLITSIDDADESITSNDTEITLIKRIMPLLGYETSFEIDFDNAPDYEDYHEGTLFGDEPVLTSSHFEYTLSGISYPLCYIKDDTTGKLVIYTIVNTIETILNDNIGTINYTTGAVKINKLLTNDYDQYISLYMKLKNKDIIINKNKILMVDLNDVSVNIVEEIS